jgi:hypothetical protein
MTEFLTHTACPVIITGRMIIIRSMEKHAVRILLASSLAVASETSYLIELIK